MGHPTKTLNMQQLLNCSTIVALFNSDIQYHRQILNYLEMAFNNSHFSMHIQYIIPILISSS